MILSYIQRQNFESENWIKIGKKTALFSFLIGTCFFIMFLLTWDVSFAMYGYMYTLLALFVNFVVLGFVFYYAIKDKNDRKKLLNTSALMFLNIPIVFVYIGIMTLYINKIKIDFVNSTQSVIENVEIEEYKIHKIDKMDIGEKTIVEFDVTHDSSVKIKYQKNGVQFQEDVMRYISSGSGGKFKYSIGQDEPIF